jgi:activator of HSP90 ATPase
MTIMTESIELSIILPVLPETIFNAWLSSEEHSAFTGSLAKIDAKPGGQFSAWDGYILDKTIELNPYQCIIQSWRTTEFPQDSPDSRLVVMFTSVEGGTKVTLIHTEIPDGQGQSYYSGWEDFYFKPMMEYFTK